MPPNCIENLKFIINQSLRLGHFPTQWKCAEIIVIAKPGKPEAELGSYRPISLLSILSKILEKLFLRRLMPVLEEKHIIPDHQFGFRRAHGTIQQCHRVVSCILDSFESKRFCSAAFLDVRQAFDRVWHQGLLYKLKHTLPTPHYLLLKDYLENRRFYVRCNHQESPIHEVAAGVPQGSVLSPILYSIYTADMPIPTGSLNMTCTYADDTAFLVSADSLPLAVQGLQQALLNIEPWLKRWNIIINAEKSTNISFSLRPGISAPVMLNGAAIPQQLTAKYLGLTLDSKLTWKEHIVGKAKLLMLKNRQMWWLLQRRSKLSIKNKLLLYNSILKPTWTYGIELWGTAAISNLKKLERVENRILRQILNAPFYVRNTTIRRDLKLPTVVEEAAKRSRRHLDKIEDHPNPLASRVLDVEPRRLKRRHPTDLPFRVP